MGNVIKRNQFPGDLGLPDHVAFASEKHLKGYLERNGFRIISINHRRVDGVFFTIKSLIKKLIGRNTFLALPIQAFTAKFRYVQESK